MAGPSPLQRQWQINKYLWLCITFVCLYIPYSRAAGRLTVPLLQAYGLFALAVVNGVVRSVNAYRLGGFNGQSAWIFNIFDIALISIGVRITGGLASDLWLAYFVIVVPESMSSNPRQTILLNVLTGAMFLLALLPEIGQPAFLLTVLTRFFFIVVVSSFGLRISIDREQRNREFMALQEQVAATEERSRIAREIHDSLGRSLVGSILRLELAGKLIRRDPDRAAEILQEETPALREAWKEGRDLAFHLKPWYRESGTFDENLCRQIVRFADRSGLNVTVEGSTGQDPQPEVEMAVLRVIQEALTNVMRHSKAEHTFVRMDGSAKRLRIEIIDDGEGFSADHRDGFGLQAMHERIRNIGGVLEIDSEPAKGTTVRITVNC